MNSEHLVPSLMAQVEEERLKRFNLENDVLRMHKSLEEGTLHVLWCNSTHVKVGGDGCSCPLGGEIKALRQQILELRKELADKKA